MKKMSDIPLIDRPVSKVKTKGAGALKDTELLEALLIEGTPDRDIRQISRDLSGLLKGNVIPSYKELIEIEGIDENKAVQILACYEIGRRYFSKEHAAVLKITRPEDVIPLVAQYREKKQEYFIAITLNGAGEVLGNRVITMGLLNHSLVHPREVFADAITDRAASIICVHNHPSGSIEPSSQDIAITRQLKEAGAIIGIPLIDHLIITRDNHTSLRERGLL